MRRLWWLPLPIGLMVSFQGSADSATWDLTSASDYDYSIDEIVISDGAAALLGATGSGLDGDLTVTKDTFDLSADASGSRSVADGASWSVTSTLSAGGTTVALDSYTAGLAVGDELLIADLQGATSDYADVGTWELVRVTALSGSTASVTALQADYDGTSHVVFAQRVPSYGDVTLTTATLTTSAFDGATGGLVAFRASG
ncbi:MAG: hypothetical protein ACI8S6_002907, partial [Myxococcota bacterium]